VVCGVHILSSIAAGLAAGCGAGRSREAEMGRLQRLGEGAVCPRTKVKRVSFIVKI